MSNGHSSSFEQLNVVDGLATAADRRVAEADVAAASLLNAAGNGLAASLQDLRAGLVAAVRCAGRVYGSCRRAGG